MRREKGDNFEKLLESVLPGFKRTAMSGAYWDNADLVSPGVVLEAKVKATKNYFSSSRKEIDKLQAQANKLGLDWIYAVEDGNKNRYILCDLNYFADLLDQIEDLKEGK